MKTYVFSVVVKPDEDRWLDFCPALDPYAAATWGYTREEALGNIGEVVEMVLQELVVDREAIPEEPVAQAAVSGEPRVSVTI